VKELNVGAELYDLWLDSLLETVEECDPEHSPEVRHAWEEVMMVGIHYLTVRYNA
jgi:hemoglobin-like flavoprotein